MLDSELHRKLAGSWNWCDNRGAIWSILTLRSDGTYSSKIYGSSVAEKIFDGVIGDEIGSWIASEYYKGEYKPHIILHMKNLSSPLISLLGPLKHLVGAALELSGNDEILYIDEITVDKIKIGPTTLNRR